MMVTGDCARTAGAANVPAVADAATVELRKNLRREIAPLGMNSSHLYLAFRLICGENKLSQEGCKPKRLIKGLRLAAI
ncbi:hypothetical protein [Phyllobacterium phragmitis]|uniref:hypothetical protein n=1 Tax=Phyllobacterium phragmitis TaxID=2670329 RepID=UPI0038B3535F